MEKDDRLPMTLQNHDAKAEHSAATIRLTCDPDRESIWKILEPMIRLGESYALARDMSREDALQYWFAPGNETFVYENDGRILGTYYLRRNQRGGGGHVANCGYVTVAGSEGRGIARAMCLHSMGRAAKAGFRGMQFNFVVSTNERAVNLWKRLGFDVVGRLPGAFQHPALGYVDALIMYRALDSF
jgi:ribosomal protein S18 acetylase RimI-like enzyme